MKHLSKHFPLFNQRLDFFRQYDCILNTPSPFYNHARESALVAQLLLCVVGLTGGRVCVVVCPLTPIECLTILIMLISFCGLDCGRSQHVDIKHFQVSSPFCVFYHTLHVPTQNGVETWQCWYQHVDSGHAHSKHHMQGQTLGYL